MLLQGLTATHLVTRIVALPWQFPNTTFNQTTTGQIPANLTNHTIPTCPSQTAYASEIRHMNSLYPSWNFTPTTLFKVLRGSNDSFAVASQVQFSDLPTGGNQTCELHLVLPSQNNSNIHGPSPSFNVYQVDREAGAAASWDTFAFKKSNASNASSEAAPYIGTVNGDFDALERTRANGGTVVVNTTECNETLTFQMAMKRPGIGSQVNYWDFINTPVGASPEQGWRVVYAVSSC